MKEIIARMEERLKDLESMLDLYDMCWPDQNSAVQDLKEDLEALKKLNP